MYIIRHKENKNYYKSKISKNMKHFVIDLKEAKKFKTKENAKKILNIFNHPENYEILELKEGKLYE